MKHRVILADDHMIIRQGLRSLINRQVNLEVVAEANDGREAVKLARELRPSIIVMDISMPNLNGVEATRQILHRDPDVKVIALSMHADAEYITRMLDAGAVGYLLKDCAFEELAQAIRTVLLNGRFISPSLADPTTAHRVRRSSPAALAAVASLTPREREVLQLIAEGKSTKETASDLGVSVKTIETHRHNIMEKLGIHSVAELTKYAIRQGLTDLE